MCPKSFVAGSVVFTKALRLVLSLPKGLTLRQVCLNYFKPVLNALNIMGKRSFLPDVFHLVYHLQQLSLKFLLILHHLEVPVAFGLDTETGQ